MTAPPDAPEVGALIADLNYLCAPPYESISESWAERVREAAAALAAQAQRIAKLTNEMTWAREVANAERNRRLQAEAALRQAEADARRYRITLKQIASLQVSENGVPAPHRNEIWMRELALEALDGKDTTLSSSEQDDAAQPGAKEG